MGLTARPYSLLVSPRAAPGSRLQAPGYARHVLELTGGVILLYHRKMVTTAVSHHFRFFLAAFAFSLWLSAPLRAAEPDAGKHCVWRVTDVPVPFYLVGSVHALSSKDYPLPAPYQTVKYTAQRFLFEYNPKLEHVASEKFKKAAKYPKGQDMRNKVHKETYDFLMKNLRRSNWGLDEILKYRPWAIAFNVWGVRGYFDISDAYGIERHFYHDAKRLGREVDGLASVDEHIEVLAGMHDADSEILLLQAFVRGDKRKDDFNALRAAWKQGDTAKLWELDARDRQYSLPLSRRLLDERNAKWIPRIEAEMKTGKSTAIVAGALHFSGPNSVIAMLQKRGHRIEQM